jgi:hypothetical protein
VSRLSRKCRSLEVSQPDGPSRRVTGRAFIFSIHFEILHLAACPISEGNNCKRHFHLFAFLAAACHLIWIPSHLQLIHRNICMHVFCPLVTEQSFRWLKFCIVALYSIIICCITVRLMSSKSSYSFCPYYAKKLCLFWPYYQYAYVDIMWEVTMCKIDLSRGSMSNQSALHCYTNIQETDYFCGLSYSRRALHINFWRLLRAALATNSGSFPSTNHHLKTLRSRTPQVQFWTSHSNAKYDTVLHFPILHDFAIWLGSYLQYCPSQFLERSALDLPPSLSTTVPWHCQWTVIICLRSHCACYYGSARSLFVVRSFRMYVTQKAFLIVLKSCELVINVAIYEAEDLFLLVQVLFKARKRTCKIIMFFVYVYVSFVPLCNLRIIWPTFTKFGIDCAVRGLHNFLVS